jgi:hypothetical protein
MVRYARWSRDYGRQRPGRPAGFAEPVVPLRIASDQSLQQLAGHHYALDLVGALVDLGDLGLPGSWRR